MEEAKKVKRESYKPRWNKSEQTDIDLMKNKLVLCQSLLPC